ncbi:MarR family winged helix-turn-helix transcriptional regulator [Nitrosococcus wardiae]|uniref:MarR family transcriptional regulator n=1 Tax=Nitrosococcus wardiae TaxID=1814290 RepID=A0A4P7C1H7_9GAMM|nr:MarR family winged helix-turn-helix transcriptional regulator [Nitrosococcus wardiae]QBQ55529.1 MarR family transcriptional regulator [Nitrosococcus wardiae]
MHKGIKFPLQKAINFIDLLREHHAEMSPHAMLCFLYVALHEELYQTDLADLVGVTEANVSRDISSQVELGLVELFDNPIGRRQKTIKLTWKGIALRTKLLKILL